MRPEPDNPFVINAELVSSHWLGDYEPPYEQSLKALYVIELWTAMSAAFCTLDDFRRSLIDAARHCLTWNKSPDHQDAHYLRIELHAGLQAAPNLGALTIILSEERGLWTLHWDPVASPNPSNTVHPVGVEAALDWSQAVIRRETSRWVGEVEFERGPSVGSSS